MIRRSLAVAAALLLSGCALGERPILTDERKPDDAAVAAVRVLLDNAGATAFSASYLITPAMVGSSTVPASVRVSPNSIEVVIGEVEYVDRDGEARTCSSGQTDCGSGIDESRISNLSVTSQFWGVSAAQRLGTDAGRMTADAVPSPETIAGQPATCARLTFDDAGATYCALATGPLARYVGADVTIELTAYASS